MGISLQKGQRISLSKDAPGLSEIMVGLGWDQVKSGEQIDCDASVLMLGADDKLEDKNNIIYFGNLTSKCKSVEHKGDNLTGEGEGDDEQVVVNLPGIPPGVQKLVFVVNIYKSKERKQHFGMIRNAFIRIVNLSDKKEMARFNLTEEYADRTSLTVAEIYRHNDEWKFAAVGQGSDDVSLSDMVKKYK
ncbi:TerD family protein [Desulfococcaceae bacterium HSG8]|nr:TerD family protein [Desulfococcaceae bacterium HSG8]